MAVAAGPLDSFGKHPALGSRPAVTVDQPPLALGVRIPPSPILKLTDVVDTWVAQRGGDPSDRTRAGEVRSPAPGEHHHAQEVSRNVSQTCRYYGITRQSYYVWLRRYEEKGLAGLEDRSCRPHLSPRATSTEVAGKIVHLRQTYHFGPQKIAMYLRRYHELVVSASGIWRILRRLGLGRLPASQRYVPYHKRWQRYEKPEPGHQLQLDVKFIAPLKGSRRRHYQFTAIDDCTRLRVLGV